MDPFRHAPCSAIAFGHVILGHDEAAADAARKTFQATPRWSYASMLVAATLAKFGRIDEARAAAARVIELEPGFTIGGMNRAVNMHESLYAPLSDALRKAGLPD